MKIQVEGKAHLKGTSKRTGNNYDFVEVHYLGKARGVDGLAAKTVHIDPQVCPPSDIVVGGVYDVEFDDRGYAVGFNLVD